MTRFGYLILAGIMALIALAAWLVPNLQNLNLNLGSDQPAPSATTTPTVTPASKDDLIVVESPLPGATISSPVTVSGRARGNWYFEASFPVHIYDANGKELAAVPATAIGEWMTTEYVPFSVSVEYTMPATQTGVLVLEKDNASGLPEHANELRIPVRFAQFDPNAAGGAAKPGASSAVKLYYYNPSFDQGPGGSACSAKGLVALDRTIPKTQTPLGDTIRLLLRGDLTDAERSRGITTEFPLPGVELVGASITNGVAALTFSDPQNKTIGGSCRTAVLRAQIEATAKQFPSVSSVRLMPQELFQP
jgi:hypothetical protein